MTGELLDLSRLSEFEIGASEVGNPSFRLVCERLIDVFSSAVGCSRHHPLS